MESNNHITVEVTEIRSPNSFWVLPLHEKRSYTEQMLNLRRDMRRHYEKRHSTDHFHENVEYRLGDIVAVKYVKSSKVWERAKIESISEAGFTEPRFVEVFLIDRGKRTQISDIASNVRPILNSNWLHIEAKAKELILAGLTPISKDFNYLELKMKNIVSTKWSELAYLMVKDFLKLSEGTYVQVKGKENIDEKKILKRIYGHLKLNMNIGEPGKIQQLINKYSEKKVYLKKYFNQANIELISVSQLLIKGRFCIETNEEYSICSENGEMLGDESTAADIHVNKENSNRSSEVFKHVHKEEKTTSEREQQPIQSRAYGSSAERLLRWPILETTDDYNISSNKTDMKFATSAAHTSSAERLMRWPLDESTPEKINIDPSSNIHCKTNESSAYHTAEDSSLKHDQSLIVAGNFIKQCKYDLLQTLQLSDCCVSLTLHTNLRLIKRVIVL